MLSPLHLSAAASVPPASPARAVEAEHGAARDDGPRTEAPSAREKSDSVDLSAAGLEALARENERSPSGIPASDNAASSSASAGAGAAPAEGELSDEEQSQVRELKARDAEVRAHEAAHLSAAGSLATGGASFDYQRGPDGASYAVGGEVGIRVGGGSTPEQRLSNAVRAQRAANAPANPSGADRSIAASASQQIATARAEIAEERAQGAQLEEQSQAPEAGAATRTGEPDATQRERQNERRAKAYGEVARPAGEIPDLLGAILG